MSETTLPTPPATETVRLVGWGTFEQLRESILPRLFGEMVTRALPVVREFHSDLFHDAEWLRRTVAGPITFPYLVRYHGTCYGEHAVAMSQIDSGDETAVLYDVELSVDGRGEWSVTFTVVPR